MTTIHERAERDLEVALSRAQAHRNQVQLDALVGISALREELDRAHEVDTQSDKVNGVEFGTDPLSLASLGTALIETEQAHRELGVTEAQ